MEQNKKQYTMTREQFDFNKKLWAKAVREKQSLSPEMHLFITLMYGNDPFKAFSPLKKEKKISKWDCKQYNRIFILWHSLKTAASNLKCLIQTYQQVNKGPKDKHYHLNYPYRERFKPNTFSFQRDSLVFQVGPETLEELLKKTVEIISKFDPIVDIEGT